MHALLVALQWNMSPMHVLLETVITYGYNLVLKISHYEVFGILKNKDLALTVIKLKTSAILGMYIYTANLHDY